METIKRCAYAKASYDPNSAHDLYDEKKAGLERFCRLIAKEYRDRQLNGRTIAVSAVYSKNKHITACIYNGKLFIGFQDKKTGEISFDDDSGDFVKMAEQVLEQLELRMMNAFSAAEKERPFLMSQELEIFWEPLYPLMEQLISYEEEFKKFPKVKQVVLENSGIKDKQINDIIRHAQRELHPLIEEALEEMYGMDIGHTGKIDPYSIMSTLEEDTLEKHYDCDIGNDGRQDDICSQSLSSRMKQATNQYQESRKEKRQIIPDREQNIHL